MAPVEPKPPRQAIACGVCGQVHARTAPAAGVTQRCCRCRAVLERGIGQSLSFTAAFALAALLLYVPANVFPILNLELYGAYSESTVWDGVHTFYRDGDYLMAGIVLMASIVVPAMKLLAIFFLVVTTAIGSGRWRLFRTRLFTTVESIGRWAMLDVFVLSIWVAVVKLGSLGHVSVGPGLLPFAGVVVCTLLSTACFDSQLIWCGGCRDEGYDNAQVRGPGVRAFDPAAPS